ncbi:hypothetical protein DL93DRAFT_2170896 [Clavulina sp. PMI_390]|nr:hypothetical protein DL93DRAFT_2170896 [Clavulina sp. PMI_390]
MHNSNQPLFRLPYELISSILENIASDEDALYWKLIREPTYPLDVKEPSDALRSMNSICHQMRSIALQSPRCWTNLVIGATNGDPKHQWDVFPSRDVLSPLLSRSKDHPINLVLYIPEDLDEDEATIESFNPSTLIRVAAAILPHLKRCQNIALIVHSDVGSPSISRYLREDAQWHSACVALNHVMIFDIGSYQRGSTWGLEPFWNSEIHQLKSLSIQGFNRFGRSISIDEQLVGPELQSLRVVGGLQNLALIQILRQCQNLDHLTLRSTAVSSSESQIPLLAMPGLRYLTIESLGLFNCDPYIISPICEQLVLNEVSLPGDMDHPEDVIFRDGLATLTKLKRCKLYYLPDLSPIIRWLHRHPTIEQLAFARPVGGPWGSHMEPQTLPLLLDNMISSRKKEESFLSNLQLLAYELREEHEIGHVHSIIDSFVKLITQLVSSYPGLRFHIFIRLYQGGLSISYQQRVELSKRCRSVADILAEAASKMESFQFTIGKMMLDWETY